MEEKKREFKKRDIQNKIKHYHHHVCKNQGLIEEENKRMNDYKNFIKSLRKNQDHEILEENIENLAEHLNHLSDNIQLLKDMFYLDKKIESNRIKDEKKS